MATDSRDTIKDLKLSCIWKDVYALLPQDSIEYFHGLESIGIDIRQSEIDATFSKSMDLELYLHLPSSSRSYYSWHVMELRKAVAITIHEQRYPVVHPGVFQCRGPVGWEHSFKRTGEAGASLATNNQYGYVYFMRNGDLFKIGITLNLLRRISELKPDELLDVVRCTNYVELERQLHSEYRNQRLPQSEYFRLHDEHVQQVHRFLWGNALR
jgi:hypothetical protein